MKLQVITSNEMPKRWVLIDALFVGANEIYGEAMSAADRSGYFVKVFPYSPNAEGFYWYGIIPYSTGKTDVELALLNPSLHLNKVTKEEYDRAKEILG